MATLLNDRDVRREFLEMLANESVTTLAKRAGVSRSFLSHVKAGRRAVPPEVLEIMGLERVTMYKCVGNVTCRQGSG